MKNKNKKNKSIKSDKSDTQKKERDSTKRKKASFIDLFYKKTGNISELCKTIKINRATFYEWKKNDPVFAQRISDGEEALIDFAESKLMENIKNNDNASIFFFLKCKAKHRGYIEKVQQDSFNFDYDISKMLSDPKAESFLQRLANGEDPKRVIFDYEQGAGTGAGNT